ncbi:MAG: hypothetical protein JRN15_09605 [Nitrososphaerota archaeon]|nr:hypothetical protein [Nitrososphaerota archaeon]
MNQDHRYIIASGYYADEKKTSQLVNITKEQFFPIWHANLMAHAQPVKTYVMNVSKRRAPGSYPGIDWIDIPHNLGHVNDFAAMNDFTTLSGWTMSALTGMMLAYSANADLIYVEQDALLFGDVVGQLYRELNTKNKQMLFGNGHTEGFIEQSLFICRREFLLEFVQQYLGFNCGDWRIIPEHKWRTLMGRLPDKIGYYDFGYGRARPANFDDRIFFIQQPTDNEIEDLRKRNLL